MTYLLALLCGCLTALPYIVQELFFLPWFTIAPLFYLAVKKKHPYRHGLAFAGGYYFVFYSWFTSVYPLDFLDMSTAENIIFIILAWVGMTLLQSVFTAFVPVLYRLLYRDKFRVTAPACAGALWCINEWLNARLWFETPLVKLAVTQTFCLPAIQSVSLFGSYFISFLLVTANGCIALCIETLLKKRGNRSEKKVKRNFKIRAASVPLSAYIAAGLILGNLLFGLVRLAVYEEPGESLTVACIQGNISSYVKWNAGMNETSMDAYSALTEQAAADGAELVLWAETVVTTRLENDIVHSGALSGLASSNGIYLAMGAFSGKTGPMHNSVFLFGPDGSVNGTVYSKRRLVPFGEYWPFSENFLPEAQSLLDLNASSGQIEAGSSSCLFNTPYGSIGTALCYDSIYEDTVRESVLDGAELLLFPSNDSWFYDSAGASVLNAHAVLRAVENNRSILRSPNTGITAIISGNGEVKATMEPLESGYVCAGVSLSDSLTLYTVLGDIIVYLSFAYLVFAGVLALADAGATKSIKGLVKRLKTLNLSKNISTRIKRLLKFTARTDEKH